MRGPVQWCVPHCCATQAASRCWTWSRWGSAGSWCNSVTAFECKCGSMHCCSASDSQPAGTVVKVGVVLLQSRQLASGSDDDDAYWALSESKHINRPHSSMTLALSFLAISGSAGSCQFCCFAVLPFACLRALSYCMHTTSRDFNRFVLPGTYTSCSCRQPSS